MDNPNRMPLNYVSVESLQDFIDAKCSEDTCRPVDLGEMAMFAARGRIKPFRVVLDVESCLDRLYSGFYPDWVSGGQWNRVVEFLTIFVSSCKAAGLDIVAFFNGTLGGPHFAAWTRQRAEECIRIKQIIRHVHLKATPPPKVWWVAPTFTETALRLCFVQLGIPIAASVDDHRLEVVNYCRQNDFSGIIGHHADYIVFGPPRYFASHKLKLTYGRNIVSDEYLINVFAQKIDISSKRLCVFATLLGTHILPVEDLVEFYCELCSLSSPMQVHQMSLESRIFAVAAFVRQLISVDDLNFVANQIFSNCGEASERVERFKQSVNYYFSGTAEGYLHQQSNLAFVNNVISRAVQKHTATSSIANKPDAVSATVSPKPTSVSPKPTTVSQSSFNKLSSELKQAVQPSSAASRSLASLNPPRVGIRAPGVTQASSSSRFFPASADDLNEYDVCRPPQFPAASSSLTCFHSSIPSGPGWTEFEDSLASEFGSESKSSAPRTEKKKPASAEDFAELVRRCEQVLQFHDYASLSSGYSAANVPMAAWQSGYGRPAALGYGHPDKTQQILCPGLAVKWWNVAPEILAVAESRHHRALMTPWIYQLMTQGEIKLPVVFENPFSVELPNVIDVYRPIRQRVYAVLYGVNDCQSHQIVKEWMIPIHDGSSSGGDQYRPCCDNVPVEPLLWDVPSIHQLWLGTSAPDKSLRIVTFLRLLGCEDADDCLLLNQDYVPPQFFILCCVIRLLLSYHAQQVFLQNELEVFLATAVSLHRHTPDDLQQLDVPIIGVRGVCLASLFMHGVEHAVLVNDVTGSPFPLNLFCPWLFFDGRLFQCKLRKAATGAGTLHDLCDNSVEQTMCVEKMRQAILRGVPRVSPFALTQATQPMSPVRPGSTASTPVPLLDIVFRPADMTFQPNHPKTRGRGALGYNMDRHGGALKVAGVIVGNWKANSEMDDMYVKVVDHLTALDPPPARGRGFRGRSGKKTGRGRGENAGTGSLNEHFGAVAPRGGSGHGYSAKSIPASDFYGPKPLSSRTGYRSLPTELLSMSYEERTRLPFAGRGRGCTIELAVDDRPGSSLTGIDSTTGSSTTD